MRMTSCGIGVKEVCYFEPKRIQKNSELKRLIEEGFEIIEETDYKIKYYNRGKTVIITQNFDKYGNKRGSSYEYLK